MSQGGVPAFGNWSAAGDTPYTQKFENLRRSKKTGVYSNPNEQIPLDQPPPPLRSPLHPSSHNTPDAMNQRHRLIPHERKPETDRPRPDGSPLHRETVARRHANPLQQHHLEHGGHGGSPRSRSPYREVAIATAAAAASPRSRYRSAGMQTPDRKASSSDGRVPLTPGRSRLKQGGRGFEPDSDEVTVPPFGDWDDANAALGEKYTGIFNRVRHDKLTPNSSVKQQPSSTSSGRPQEHKVQQVCSCCIL